MEIILFLVAAVVIMLAVFAGLSAQSPLFIFVVVAAMLSGLASPAWHLIYGIVYDAELYYLIGDSIPLIAFLGGWIMVFPTLLIFATLRRSFVHIGKLGMWGLISVIVIFFWVFESVGVAWQIWSYDNEITALGFPTSLFLALLHTLCAIILLRVMFEYWRIPTLATLPVVPIFFGLQAFCYAIIGAPFYAMEMLTGTSVLTSFGLVCTVLVIGWGLHTTIESLLSIQSNTSVTAGLYVADIAVLEELARQKNE